MASVQTQRGSESRDYFFIWFLPGSVADRGSAYDIIRRETNKKNGIRKMVLEITLINNSILNEDVILKYCRQLQNLCRHITK